MIKKTRWSPDTCGCVLEYEWDDAIPEDQRTHTPINTVHKCDKHIHLSSHEDIHTEVIRRNKLKNEALSHLHASFHPDEHKNINFHYDEEDNLVFTTPEINGLNKKNLETSIKSKFSDNKIKVQ